MRAHNHRTTNRSSREQFCKSFFGFPQKPQKRQIHEIRKEISLIEIHMEKGFRFVEIRVWISRFIGKSEIRI